MLYYTMVFQCQAHLDNLIIPWGLRSPFVDLSTPLLEFIPKVPRKAVSTYTAIHTALKAKSGFSPVEFVCMKDDGYASRVSK